MGKQRLYDQDANLNGLDRRVAELPEAHMWEVSRFAPGPSFAVRTQGRWHQIKQIEVRESVVVARDPPDNVEAIKQNQEYDRMLTMRIRSGGLRAVYEYLHEKDLKNVRHT